MIFFNMSTNSKLRQIADQLPLFPKLKNGKIDFTYAKRIVYGDEILKENPDAKDEKGNPILANKQYGVLKPIIKYHNHFLNLKNIFKNDGESGVNKYINTVFEFNKIENTQNLNFQYTK